MECVQLVVVRKEHSGPITEFRPLLVAQVNRFFRPTFTPTNGRLIKISKRLDLTKQIFRDVDAVWLG
jgi:hypothetical protein